MKQRVRTDCPADIPALIEKARGQAESLEIVIAGGDHFIKESIVIQNPGFPVFLTAEPETRLIGGRRLKNAAPVAESIQRKRFPFARHAVFSAALPLAPAPFTSRGFGRPTSPSHSEAFCGQTPLRLAQYPKPGRFLSISGFGKAMQNEWGQENGALDGGFFYEDERPCSWAASDDLLVHGYWSYDWANSCEKVTRLDPQRGFVETAPPNGNYDFRKNQRFFFLNIAEEVSEPGEYYIDRADNTLYFIPPDDDAEQELIVSFLTTPMLCLENASDITVSGLSFEACCGHGLLINGGENLRIENCRFANIGSFAVFAEHTKRLTIAGLDVCHTGDGGISVTAGDRPSLTSGETVIENNHLRDIAAWSKTYVCPINAAGVGFTIAHNLIHDCPHMGILFWGNDFTIENNEIYSVLLETGDAGAIYTGRDYTFRGNVVRRNFIHHLGGVGMGTMGIYNDDCVSGTLMCENVFFECSRAVFMGGGRDFVTARNLFVNCYPSIEADGRGTSSHEVWRNMVTKLMRTRFYEIRNTRDNADDMESPIAAGNKPPYSTKYPALAEIDRLYQSGDAPLFYPGGTIEDNFFCSNRKTEYTWSIETHAFTETGGKDLSPADFTDFAHGILDLAVPPKNGPVLQANVGLTGPRRESLPQVFSGLALKEGRLVLLLKNGSAFSVAGDMAFFTNDAAPPSPVSFSLAPYALADLDLCAAPAGQTIEGRSGVPGVRPCRITL